MDTSTNRRLAIISFEPRDTGMYVVAPKNGICLLQWCSYSAGRELEVIVHLFVPGTGHGNISPSLRAQLE